MRYICALTIAGSDSCGGAGVQADIKTMSALGVYAASAITAVTVQNTQGVQAIQAIEPEIVAGQIKAVMDDIRPNTVKIGMVNDKATIQAIADTLKLYPETSTRCRPRYGVDQRFYAHAARCPRYLLSATLAHGRLADAQYSRGFRTFSYLNTDGRRHGSGGPAHPAVRL